MPSMFISDINIYLLLRYYSLTTSLSYKAISSVLRLKMSFYCLLQFVKGAKEICDALRDRQFWADFVDPSSGRPVSNICIATLYLASACVYCGNRTVLAIVYLLLSH